MVNTFGTSLKISHKNKKMKLQFEKTEVWISDEKGNNWMVQFTGEHTKLTSRVFKNGKFICSYLLGCGHANKTKAMQIVKNAESE